MFGARERELCEVLADQAAIAVDRMLRERAMADDLERKRRDLEIARRRSARRRSSARSSATARSCRSSGGTSTGWPTPTCRS
ncbi:MAG: hypothetical protein R3F30_06570 [Planctomycetota bacterium]